MQQVLTLTPALPDIPYSSVEPNTTLYICRGIPLPSNYSDTLTFANQQSQLAYFSGKLKYTVNNLSPATLQKPLAVPYVADDLYDCNYIIFQNKNFNNKYFFCFINQVQYVNLSTSLVFFEIDVMQTYYFDMVINPCLVEREHTNNDSPGSNTLGESLPLGEYVRKSRIRTKVTKNTAVQVSSPANVNEGNKYNQLNGGIFSGLTQSFFPVEQNTAPGLSDFLQTYVNQGKEGDIIAVQMIPADFITKRGDANPVSKTISIAKTQTQIDGYTPKNKKLLQYPYIYIEIDNTQGQTAIYKLEYFSGNECEFKILGMTNGDSPQLVLYPLNYDGIGDNVIEHITLGGFPQCAWAGDAYKVYLANNSIKEAYHTVAAVGGVVAAVASGGSGAAAAAAAPITWETIDKASRAGSGINGQKLWNSGESLGSTISNYMQEEHNAQIAPDTVRGTQGSDVLFASGLMDFWVTIRSIDASHARAIDDYFTRFGYRVDTIKVPNITGRQSWNYVKTVNCNIGGSIPFTDRAKINQIFNNGITFWHGDYVGNYGRSNNIV